MEKDRNTALDKRFAAECKVINLKYEYPGYTGNEQWGIITKLSESELNDRYANQIAGFKPFILLTAAFGKARDDFRRNENKHRMRAIRSFDMYSWDDEEFEAHHPELSVRAKDPCLEVTRYDELYKAIELLPETQRRRLKLCYFVGYTEKVIAEIEGCSPAAVHFTI